MNKYDKVMKKVNKFYQNPKKEELYNLDDSIIEFLIPRLEQFIVDSSKIIDWNFHKEEGTDVIGITNSIIEDLKFIKDNKWDCDNNLAKECMKRSKRAFKNLGNIIFFLQW